MPVRKFRSVYEMDEPAWYQPGDPALARALARLWTLGRQVTPRRFEPGVRRFRSIEEMSRDQGKWVVD